METGYMEIYVPSSLYINNVMSKPLSLPRKPTITGLVGKKNPAVLNIMPKAQLSGDIANLYKNDNEEFSKFRYFSTNKFLLTGLRESREEKVQTMETFAEPSLFFFGERIRVYTLRGLLFEDKDNTKDWSDDFMFFYDNYLRAEKLVENNAIALLRVLDHEIYGYPSSLNMGRSSQFEHSVEFTMNFIVASHKIYGVKVRSTAVVWEISAVLGITEALKDMREAISAYENEIIKTGDAYSLDKVKKTNTAKYKAIVKVEILRSLEARYLEKLHNAGGIKTMDYDPDGIDSGTILEEYLLDISLYLGLNLDDDIQTEKNKRYGADGTESL